MDFNLASLEPKNRYKLLNCVVIPRPIAWITSVNEEGIVNAAPFSYFNLMGIDPPIITLGLQYRNDFKEGIKDTPKNIRTNGTFVINIVNEKLARKMDLSSAFYPSRISETEELDVRLTSSAIVNVPRIAEAPASIECREHTTMFIGNTRVVIAEALHLWIQDELVDPEKFYVDMEAMQVIGRGGAGKYIHTKDLFDFKSYD